MKYRYEPTAPAIEMFKRDLELFVSEQGEESEVAFYAGALTMMALLKEMNDKVDRNLMTAEYFDEQTKSIEIFLFEFAERAKDGEV